ncbi:uncharacterized protein K444DRAFT_638802 [Hyaloscypha bicolor E]|uniref:DUF6594 domain-containing protein n=1 Tax=Hyaloscypha bicolor E TaxID=1095630 RepID=A0A2J6SEW6_9HELO|nr:uncharacterized protein K444DRAFT_638802 [Hyaloscypha bicolor E]PMD49300.1 hypothetical protein K444DRAFT_638802 [Hyaloscypha bicolor E]
MEGYSKLASLMGDARTDGHFLIFQKFESISAQNLLYLQAEITNLKESIDKIAQIDSENPERKDFAVDWETLSSSTDSIQYEKWLELRRKLKEYYKAIAHHMMITGLPAPRKYDLDFLQKWLERPSLGNSAFIGADCDVYDKPAGLGTLAAGGGQVDAMTRLLLNVLPNLYHWGVVHPLHRICGEWIKKPESHRNCGPSPQPESTSGTEEDRKSCQDVSVTSTTSLDNSPTLRPSTESTSDESSFDIEANIFLYRDTHFHRVATILGTLVSSLIPIAAIIVLSFVRDMTARLGAVCAFTAIFSVCLSLVTEAKRVENFAATAAFASVQVVFVGSTNVMMR